MKDAKRIVDMEMNIQQETSDEEVILVVGYSLFVIGCLEFDNSLDIGYSVLDIGY